MEPKDVANLHCGDEVFWSDPDDSSNSRHYTIQTIKVTGITVRIVAKDGSVLEAFLSELS